MALSSPKILFVVAVLVASVQGFSTPSTTTATTTTRLSAAGAAWTEADLLKEKEQMSGANANDDVEPVPRLVRIRAELLDPDCDFNAPEEELLLSSSSEDGATVLATKIVHFQRHGQGYHNLLGDVLRDVGVRPDIHSADPSINPWIRPEIVDSPLTELGKKQCEAQRARASLLQPQAVIVSPLSRAIQTAKLSFADYLLQENNNKNKIPWIAHEGCREELGWLVCNQRRPLSEICADFPFLREYYPTDMTEDDTLWNPSRFESETHKGNRIYEFLVHFLAQRPETNLAVVCHSAWLSHMCNFVLDCGGNESLTSWFDVAEIRSVKLTFYSDAANDDDDETTA